MTHTANPAPRRRHPALVPAVLAALAVVTTFVTACTGGPGTTIDARATGTAPGTTKVPHAAAEPYTLTTRPAGNLVYASGPSTFVAIDRTSGDRRYERPASLLATDGSDLFTTEIIGSMTNVVASDPATGEARWSSTLDGAFVGRIVGPHGRQLALMPAEPPAQAGTGVDDGYIARGRVRSSIVVATTAGTVPQRFELEGNFEPEAFSIDGTMLYVVQFTPAAKPDHYRVQQLDLRSGVVNGVYGNTKELQGEMPGQSRTFVPAPDGHARYTLYTMLMPPDGHDPRGGHAPGPPHAAGETHAFVHVLDVQAATANCIDLPSPFGLKDPQGLAIATSPTGAWLAVVDTAAGVLGIVDPSTLQLVSQARIDAMTGGQTSITATADGAVVVARGSTIVVMSAAGQRSAQWTAPGAVDGVVVAAGQPLVYVSSGGKIFTFDLAGHPKGEVGALA